MKFTKKLPSPDLTPSDVKVLGLLRPHINQFADGKTTTFTRRKHPTQSVAPLSAPLPIPEPVCIPISGFNMTVSPPDNPLVIGVSYTYSTGIVDGTPINAKRWYYADTMSGTSDTLTRVLSAGDLTNVDPITGIGQLRVLCIAANPCGLFAPASITVFTAGP